MKTAAALRASDTAFLQDSMPKLIEEINNPKQSPVQEAALRAVLKLFGQSEKSVETDPIFETLTKIAVKHIAYEFAFVDELVECLREIKRSYRDPVCINFTKLNEVMEKTSDLLERIEKGKK